VINTTWVPPVVIIYYDNTLKESQVKKGGKTVVSDGFGRFLPVFVGSAYIFLVVIKSGGILG
jgi:hypothetical protein